MEMHVSQMSCDIVGESPVKFLKELGHGGCLQRPRRPLLFNNLELSVIQQKVGVMSILLWGTTFKNPSVNTEAAIEDLVR